MKRAKNAKQTEDTWVGQTIQPDAYYEIQAVELSRWQVDDKVLTDIGSGDLILNDGTNDLTGVNQQIDFLKDTQASEVVTQTEKPDKALQLASVEAAFTGNECIVDIPIPGDVGTVGRLVAGGYGFTDVYGWGDRISRCELVDTTYAYAGLFYPATPTEAGIPDVEGLTWAQVMPDGVVLGSYHDTDVAEALQGWRLWCDNGNQGGVDIDPIGGFGKLYGVAVLRIVFLKTEASLAAHAAVNVWWGKPE